MDTKEEAVQKITSHLRILSRVCDKSLANVDLDMIRDSRKSMEESKKKKVNKNGELKNEKNVDKEFKEKALEEIRGLKFAEKLSNYEDRIMNMVKQYYIVQSAKPKADAKLKRAKMKLRIRQIDLRLFQRLLHKVQNNAKTTLSANVADKKQITETNKFIHSIIHNTKGTSPVLRNEFGEEEGNTELEENDLTLGQDIKRFLEETESVYKSFMTDENRSQVSEQYYLTIRCLLMHITCQARQYWDAANAVDVLVEMKCTLQSVNEEISATIDQYYKTAQNVRDVCASIQNLRRLIRRTSNSRTYSYEEFLFFSNYDNFFE
ncbi:unnamed protein product [Caenorhabditis brenneri]